MIAHLIILIHLNLTHIVLMTLNLLMDFILVSILVTNLTNDRMTILMITNRNRITVFLEWKFRTWLSSLIVKNSKKYLQQKWWRHYHPFHHEIHRHQWTFPYRFPNKKFINLRKFSRFKKSWTILIKTKTYVDSITSGTMGLLMLHQTPPVVIHFIAISTLHRNLKSKSMRMSIFSTTVPWYAGEN